MAVLPTRTLQERQWREVISLAWWDFVHEWPVSLCLVFALAAVLSPLLVLFGLKSGIVTTMTERLTADPVNREVVIRGHHSLSPAWFEAMAARPDVAFVVPRTRLLSATITLETADGRSLQDLDMIPTGADDPLLPAVVPQPHGVTQVILTHTAASRLKVVNGARLEGLINRRLAGRAEAVRLPLTVIGVLPETAFGRDAALVSLELLVAAEDYRDGYAVPVLDVSAGAEGRADLRTFASARLYARSLDDVASLAAELRRDGIEVVTRAREIETVKAIDRVLTLIFLVLAAIGVTGVVLSLAASLWANVERKRRDIALLRLMGLRARPVIGFPATQAALVAGGGILLSIVIYAVVATVFNRAFAAHLGREEFVCRLEPAHALLAAGLTLLFALSASIVGGSRAACIDPAESLREP